MSGSRRCGPDWLHDKLEAGELVVIDGATGTELEARGVPMNKKAWSGVALLSHPEVVRAVHADYIAAGAEVIITNTFAAGRQMLEPAGLADQLVTINRSAVEVARQARDEVADGPVAIAGSMCEWVDDGEDISRLERLSGAYCEQAELLAEAGVDLIALEMCSHPLRTALVVEAAVATGLPIWLGLSCRHDSQTGRIVGFDKPHAELAPLVAELVRHDIGAVNVMHSAVEDTSAGLDVVRPHWPGPLGAYPESGHFVMPNWQFVDIIEPDDLVRMARHWVQSGVQILGGCCGLGVAHVKALKTAFG